MPPTFLSPQRLIGLGVALFLVLLFFFSAVRQGSATAPIKSVKEAAKTAAESAADHLCPAPEAPAPQELKCPPEEHQPLFSEASFARAIAKLYEPIRVPVTKKHYYDATGREFVYPEDAPWKETLGKKILIVDMDTRIPTGPNELWNEDQKMDFEALDATKGPQMVSAALMNHFLYSQIHGYDYKFFAAKHMEDLHDTWIKPHVLYELLHDYQFVVFIDADATIQHLELPLEWMFNKWNITEHTSIALPIDTMQNLNGNEKASLDSKGEIEANTGFLITQAMPHTFDMLDAWRKCPTGEKYPECKQWATNWSHEQKAFSEYIRYDFNPDHNIVKIPCDDAMGYPGLKENNPHIISNCTGQFIRHHTIGKERTKVSMANAMLQNMAELMQKALLKNKSQYWMAGDAHTESFLEKFQKHD